MKTRIISHVLPTIARNAGGPSVSVRRLTEALQLAMPGEKLGVFAGDATAGRNALADWQAIQPSLSHRFGPSRMGWSPGLRPALTGASPSLIHLHGLWHYHAWAADGVARTLGIPLVVSPRGMVEPWALRQGRPQKWLANLLFQKRMLVRAACIIATSRLEAEGVRVAGFTAAPVAVIPNGVDLPPGQFHAYGAYHQDGRGSRTALFLSRIHPKKGILDLLAAWKTLAPAGWRLRIVGPGEGTYAAEVEAYIKANDLAATVDLEGPLWGAAKLEAYAQSDLFVLPSYSENFGLVIAEALAAGLPVVTTRATPWEELERERCGWWIEPGRAALTATLQVALQVPSGELAAMGRRGRVLMERRYAWPAVARDMAEIYRWLLGETKAPPAHLMFS